jgi:hypothetical protein
MKSFRAKDGSDEPPSGSRNSERDFHGEKRSNDTHSSTTDPEFRLYRKGKGKEAKLSYIGSALTEKPSRAGGRGRTRLDDGNHRTRGDARREAVRSRRMAHDHRLTPRSMGDRHWPQHAAPSPPRVHPLPQYDRGAGPRGKGDPRRRRQLCDPQASKGAPMAGAASRWRFHFTPTSAVWLSAVEGFFAKLTPRLQRGVFRLTCNSPSTASSQIQAPIPSPSYGPPTQSVCSPLSNAGSKR